MLQIGYEQFLEGVCVEDRVYLILIFKWGFNLVDLADLYGLSVPTMSLRYKALLTRVMDKLAISTELPRRVKC